MGLFDGGKRNKKSNLEVPSAKACNSYPFLDKSFRIRVEECWKNFVKEEAV